MIWDKPRTGSCAEHGFHVDARRRHEPIDETHAVKRRLKVGARDLQYFSNQRKAVGMGSRGRQSQNDVTGARCGSIDDGVLFHDPDAETRQIVVLAVIHARHLGRFAAHQCAAGLHAPLDDAGDQAFAHAHIELARRKVVEKKQRLGALDDHVVDAHGHQIDAHRSVAVGVDREAQLGADSVGSRHEHGLAIAIERYFDQGAETAYPAEHLAAHRTPH